jgi:signal transduction histidine kinase
MHWHVLNISLYSPRGEHAIPALIAFLIEASLLLLALARGPRTRLVRVFCANMLALGLWAFGIYQLAVATNDYEGVFWLRTLNACAFFIPSTFFHYVCLLTGVAENRRNRLAIGIAYATSILFALTAPTDLLMSGIVHAPGFYYYPQFGPVLYLDAIFYAIYLGWSFIIAFRAVRLDHPRGNEIRYAFLAYLIAFAGGLQTFLPAFGLPMWPYALYLVPLGLVFVSYSVISRRLLDFEIVIRQTVIYSVLTALLTAVYVVVVFMLANLVKGRLAGSTTAFSYAIAAVTITLLFHPFRMAIQRWVDKHFFRVLLDDQFLQELTSGFVHELKRPLAHISMPAELAIQNVNDILERGKPARELLLKIRERLQHILASAIDASRRIDAVRQLNSRQAGARERVYLKDVLLKSLALTGATDRVDLLLETNVPDALPAVVGDSKQLELVFMNIIKNALEAMEPPCGAPRLSIEGLESGRMVRISVKDSGPGIPPEQRSRLFEPYFTTKSSRGMGMGLYLAQQVIKAHRGKIDARFSGEGAEFIVSLPWDKHGSF